MERYYTEYRNGFFAVIDRKTDTTRINCQTLSEAQAHCRGLNR